MAVQQRTYLRTIAIWKLVKGVVMLFFGIALVFLEIRHEWLASIITWIDEELLTPRKGVLFWIAEKVLTFLTSDKLRSTGIIALVYSAVLMVEGVGVYLEKRWAEWLMVIATGGLIPLEVYHVFHKFTVFRVVVLVANVAIVVYLYRTLRRTAHHSEKEPQASNDKENNNEVPSV